MSAALRLAPLYRIRFTYPECWTVSLDGGWEQHLILAEGRCEGAVSGRFRGANFPLRQGPDGPFRPDFRAVIESDDGPTIMFEWHGYGRAYPPGRRQIVEYSTADVLHGAHENAAARASADMRSNPGVLSFVADLCRVPTANANEVDNQRSP